MGNQNQTQDDRKQNPQGNPRQGAPGTRENVSGGEEAEDNTIERRTDDAGVGREQQAGSGTDQTGEMDDEDIERPDIDDESDSDEPDSPPR